MFGHAIVVLKNLEFRDVLLHIQFLSQALEFNWDMTMMISFKMKNQPIEIESSISIVIISSTLVLVIVLLIGPTQVGPFISFYVCSLSLSLEEIGSHFPSLPLLFSYFVPKHSGSPRARFCSCLPLFHSPTTPLQSSI